MLDELLKRLPRWLREQAPAAPLSAPHAGVTYLGEPDHEGLPPLKQLLVQKLRLAPAIRKAFVVKALLPGAPAPGLLLVLVTASEPAESLSRALLDVVKSSLQPEQSLTLKLIKPADCAPLERMCRPFYYAV